jgi:hypothetical protein
MIVTVCARAPGTVTEATLVPAPAPVPVPVPVSVPVPVPAPVLAPVPVPVPVPVTFVHDPACASAPGPSSAYCQAVTTHVPCGPAGRPPPASRPAPAKEFRLQLSAPDGHGPRRSEPPPAGFSVLPSAHRLGSGCGAALPAPARTRKPGGGGREGAGRGGGTAGPGEARARAQDPPVLPVAGWPGWGQPLRPTRTPGLEPGAEPGACRRGLKRPRSPARGRDRAWRAWEGRAGSEDGGGRGAGGRGRRRR